ncbi:gephyrin-like molybdotransferase Glp [Demequina sp. NBRC 110056]|uniref:molybdopterin molybdotransferase MoeA n=1 Tax=Demequina sp. NBRC 110056 TaxID=1570345 RepID=UPI001F45F09A|nr:gephyrin-like molybdotransferase Glp [Demequina sp. NBRC 110056]
MRDLDDHVAHALTLVAPLAPRTMALAAAHGAVTAADHVALSDSPPFDNSAMDGYAVRAADARAASERRPVALTVAGETAAGAAPAVLPEGRAWRIMTGAPLPDGADAVIPVELTDGGLERVVVLRAVEPGRHVRRAGEDCRAGDIVVPAGVELTAARLASLAAAGVGEVATLGAPTVAVLATGDELVDPGAPLGPGQIHDSNAILLTGLVREAGAAPVVLDRVPDEPAALLERLADVDADLLVTTGGVSVGAYDVVKAALAPRGIAFVKVAMQPGKPQGLGMLDGTPIACLPGNPVSVLVSFATIVAPMIRRLRGVTAEPETETAVVAAGWRTPPERRQLMPVRFVSPGHVEPATAGGSGSHLVASLASAEALADVPVAVAEVQAGDTVSIVRWSR